MQQSRISAYEIFDGEEEVIPAKAADSHWILIKQWVPNEPDTTLHINIPQQACKKNKTKKTPNPPPYTNLKRWTYA